MSLDYVLKIYVYHFQLRRPLWSLKEIENLRFDLWWLLRLKCRRTILVICQMQTRWGYSWSNPAACEVGSAHNRATILIWPLRISWCTYFMVTKWGEVENSIYKQLNSNILYQILKFRLPLTNTLINSVIFNITMTGQCVDMRTCELEKVEAYTLTLSTTNAI
jgi:hypothetical protein